MLDSVRKLEQFDGVSINRWEMTKKHPQMAWRKCRTFIRVPTEKSQSGKDETTYNIHFYSLAICRNPASNIPIDNP
jgi:hypothetical protein